jgi:hypothetical protein
MKPRTVLVTLEIVTDATLATLKDRRNWTTVDVYSDWEVRQVTASVQQQPETKGRGKRP